METTKKIDQDIESLHSEMDRRDGKIRFHCTRKCKYGFGIAVLLLFMVAFGVLTKPTMFPQPAAELLPAVADGSAKRVVQPELDARLASLYEGAKKGGVLIPRGVSEAKEPRIVSWTPGAIGKVSRDGAPVPIKGMYEIPAGWYGIIRVFANLEEIGSVMVDGRSLGAPASGEFSLIPMAPRSGGSFHRITLDAVHACRITCSPSDQLCLAVNVNHCTALSDNQKFLTYRPQTAAESGTAGQCQSQTFTAGPKHEPQIPEDYMLCDGGSIVTNFLNWVGESNFDEPTKKNIGQTIPSIIRAVAKKELVMKGNSGNVFWKLSTTKGDSERKVSCAIVLETQINCPIVDLESQSTKGY